MSKRALEENCAVLVCKTKVFGEPPVIPLDSEQFIIGRSPTSTYNIADITVSRNHCTFKYLNEEWNLYDQSSSGTYINGERLKQGKPIKLQDGDEIKIGISNKYIFQFYKCYDCNQKKSKNDDICGSGYDVTDLQNKSKMIEEQFYTQLKAASDGISQFELQKMKEKLNYQMNLQKELLMQQKLQQQKRKLYEGLAAETEKLLSNHEENSCLDSETSHDKKYITAQRELESSYHAEIFEVDSQIKANFLRQQELKCDAERNELLLLKEREDFKIRFQEEQKILQEKLNNVVKEKDESEKDYQKKISELEMKYQEELSKLHNELHTFSHLQQTHTDEKIRLEQKYEEERMAERQKFEENNLEMQKHLEQLKALLEKNDALEKMTVTMSEYHRSELDKLEKKHSETVSDNAKIIEELRNELIAKEANAKKELEIVVENLNEEKQKLENEIRAEMAKKECESEEQLKKLQEELKQVKAHAESVENTKKLIEQKLEETEEKATSSSMKLKQEVIESYGEMLETELQCSICNELFVHAMVLNCSHTFCKFCISEWKKKKKECPVCRAGIVTEVRSLVLDNFISKMIETLPEEMKHRRHALVEERSVIALLTPTKKKKQNNRTSTTQREQRSTRAQTTFQNTNVTGAINLTTSTDSSDIDTETDNSFDEESSYESSVSSVEGEEGIYYGGYGHCFNCGRRGHWANGCPYR